MSDSVAMDPFELELVDEDMREDVAAMETLNAATEEEETLARLKAWKNMLGSRFPKTASDFVGYEKSQFRQSQYRKNCVAMMAKAPHALIFQPWFYVKYMGPRMQRLWYFGRLRAGKEVSNEFDPMVRGLGLASAQEDFPGPIVVPEALPSGSGPYTGDEVWPFPRQGWQAETKLGTTSRAGTSTADAGRKEVEKAVDVAAAKTTAVAKRQQEKAPGREVEEADGSVVDLDSETEGDLVIAGGKSKQVAPLKTGGKAVASSTKAEKPPAQAAAPKASKKTTKPEKQAAASGTRKMKDEKGKKRAEPALTWEAFKNKSGKIWLVKDFGEKCERCDANDKVCKTRALDKPCTACHMLAKPCSFTPPTDGRRFREHGVHTDPAKRLKNEPVEPKMTRTQAPVRVKQEDIDAPREYKEVQLPIRKSHHNVALSPN
ncbi:hypothetical protein CALCODRAFT_478889 [Calocera cornea HHB12733]|uniref:Uncharacterized protein n=1 Tax=Calocera cornea HHB12733 TaxID=1353952 RepID=A0A165K2C4_9BASI|nr:hypothetical protein CALCODRAFT_478889 [Calocera cornea HHB12733]